MNSQSIGYKAKVFEPRNLLFFFLIAFGWSWFWWALFIFGILKLPAGIGTSEVNFVSAAPFILIVLVAPYGPTLAGFVMAAMTEGKTGVKALWKRFWTRNLNIKWLLVCMLFFPVIQLIANLVTRTLDNLAYPLLAYPSLGVFVNAFIFDGFIHGGMSEEFGWRGYALPRFQAKWNALTSSIVIGAIWASWHIPLWYFPGDEHSQVNFWEWALLIILFSIMMTWIFNNTNGNVLAAVLFHAMANAASSLFWCCGSSIWHRDGVWWLVTIIIVMIFGSKNLVRQPQEEERYIKANHEYT